MAVVFSTTQGRGGVAYMLAVVLSQNKDDALGGELLDFESAGRRDVKGFQCRRTC